MLYWCRYSASQTFDNTCIIFIYNSAHSYIIVHNCIVVSRLCRSIILLSFQKSSHHNELRQSDLMGKKFMSLTFWKHALYALKNIVFVEEKKMLRREIFLRCAMKRKKYFDSFPDAYIHQIYYSSPHVP